MISGNLTVTLGKTNHILVAGERRIAPMKTPHTFTNNDDDPVVFRVRLTPPSQFEQSVRIHYGLMEDGLTDSKGNPKLLAHTALVLLLQNTLIAGIPLWIQRSIFGLIVKRAHKRGLYEALEKYTGRPYNPHALSLETMGIMIFCKPSCSCMRAAQHSLLE